MAMVGNFNSLLIFNAFDEKYQVRLPLAEELGNTAIIQQIYISPEYVIYLLMENYVDKKYEIWYVDLDHPSEETDFKKKIL
jgi:hypothetical protein